MPESAELAALWDRFVLRYSVEYVKSEASFASMLSGGGPTPLVGSLTLTDWAAARTEVDSIPLGADVMPALFALRQSLATAGVVVSDRRWVKALKLLRANAWLSGAVAVSPYHMEILSACLWNTAEQIPTVRAEVMKIAAAEVLVAERAATTAIGLVSNLPDSKARDFLDRASSVREELKKALTRIADIRTRLVDPGAIARVLQVEEEVKNEGRQLTARIKAAVGIDF
jgi:MoxR-like ATPase